MSKDTGGAAFPQPTGIGNHDSTAGMTLRDYFAGQVLTGLMANNEIEIDQQRIDVKEQAAKLCAVWCYSVADAMLAERNKQ